MLNHIENEIRATESLSVLLAEVITARSININTDYLLSHVHKALRRTYGQKWEKQDFASRATWASFHFIPFFLKKSCCVSVRLSSLPDHFRLHFDVHHQPMVNLEPWLKTCTCPCSGAIAYMWGEAFFSLKKKKKISERFKNGPVTQKKWAVQHATRSYSLIFYSQNAFCPTDVWVFNLVEGGWTKLSILQVKTVCQCEIHQRNLFRKGENVCNKEKPPPFIMSQ